MNRADRRHFETETRALFAKIRDEHHSRRKSAIWPDWNMKNIYPGEIGGNGWTMEIHTAYENALFAVLIRTCQTAWGPIDHACISTLVGDDIAWRDKQRIKNELFGNERTAVEVFPAESDLIDDADSYHLWVLPPGFRLPFTIGKEDQDAA